MEHQLQEINCPICMTTFKRPLTISCGHTFCYSCLNNSLRDHRNCPICRQHITSMPNKVKVDERIQHIIDHYRKTIYKSEAPAKRQNIYTQCKAQRLLLIDITTEDLMLPYNKITAIFQLQSNSLIDRMQRFVARQEIPFNKYPTVCKLVHIEEIRKNLFKGILQAYAFCTIESEQVESEVSLEMDDEEYFYRTCNCKEISQTTETNPNQFDLFFEHFNKIQEHFLNKLIFSRIDPAVFIQKNDSIAIFYSILGIINLSNDSKYKIATTFDEEKRISFIKQYLEQNKEKIKSKPSSLVHIPSQRGVNRTFLLFILFFIMVYLFAQSQDM